LSENKVLVELEPEVFHSVAPLFAGIDHDVALVYGVVQGHSPGRIFVDRRGDPTGALLVSHVGYSYVGGRSSDKGFVEALPSVLFDIVLPQMEEQELILFAFSDDWRAQLDAQLEPRGAIVIYRKVFRFDPDCFAAHAKWRARIPKGFEMRAVDADLAANHPQYESLAAEGSGRFGVCLVRGDEVVSACTAVSVGGGQAEVDIYTEEAYRRRGYGYLTACAFIEQCLARGLTPSWACWPYREASQALAEKLGFEACPDVPAHYWAETM